MCISSMNCSTLCYHAASQMTHMLLLYTAIIMSPLALSVCSKQRRQNKMFINNFKFTSGIKKLLKKPQQCPFCSLNFKGWCLTFKGWCLTFKGWCLTFKGWCLTFKASLKSREFGQRTSRMISFRFSDCLWKRARGQNDQFRLRDYARHEA